MVSRSAAAPAAPRLGRLMAATPLLVALLLSLVAPALGDVYMHNPRGSNDRNCERNVNRQNGNRMFDSQNNAKGGYACPRAVGGPDIVTGKMYYYVGSKLPIEWTAQHGCGTNPKEHCELVLQYACEDTLDANQEFRFEEHVGAPRDGIPRGADDDATDTIPADYESARANTVETRRFGMHENYNYYHDCQTRMRNMGLFTADQRVRRNDARGTRQNPNGNRNGLECPEERDYYPYWHPTPWRDIAVITSHDERCDYFQENSQNVRPYGHCFHDEDDEAAFEQLANQGRWYNNRMDCEANGFTWREFHFGDPKFIDGSGSPAPVCQQGYFGRINHLGNAAGTNYDDPADETAIPHNDNANRYVWTIPDHPNENCVLRMRYNISTADYAAWDLEGNPVYNASFNGENSKIQQDPYISIGEEEDEFLSLALNTNQYGRTFQDRSYVFEIRSDPRGRRLQETAKIYNLNVRGKRGNIVQTYPAVEYDFVPNDLNVREGDLIHFQWTGSDYNPRRGCNDAEGGPPDPNTPSAANQNSRADRSNIVQMENMDENYPADISTVEALTGRTMFVDANGNPDLETVQQLSFLRQKEILAATGRKCLTEEELEAISNKNQRENHPQNCAKLNAAQHPYFDAGAVQVNNAGRFTAQSTRNNNFSNRDQTMNFCVASSDNDMTDCHTEGLEANTGAPNAHFSGGNSAVVIDGVAIDEPGAQNSLIDGETTAPIEKDNDGVGDGEKEACEARLHEFLSSIGIAGIVAIAVALLMVGIIGTLIVQGLVRRYKGDNAWLQQSGTKV